MKAFPYLAASMIVAAASFPALCHAQSEAPLPARATANECAVSADPSIAPTGTASKPPVLSVGVSDPNTKLNLPWFLTDIVNAVNTHQSARCFAQALRRGI